MPVMPWTLNTVKKIKYLIFGTYAQCANRMKQALRKGMMARYYSIAPVNIAALLSYLNNPNWTLDVKAPVDKFHH